jgi:non-ribosomal peptide synthetase component E (peptide arylation enzyme)
VTRRVVDRWDVGFCHVFGMGEGPQIVTRPDDPLEVQAETVGRPIGPGDEVRIVDEDGDPVPRGDLGELVARGPGVFTGYLRNPRANAEDFDGIPASEASGESEDQGSSGKWFYTGDVFARRKDGNYEVFGRMDDSINRAGETIHATAVEDVLVEHPKVASAAVVGVPDRSLGERVGAAVELAEDADFLTLEEVTEFFEERGTAVYLRPERLTVLKSLPETEVGKVDRDSVRSVFEGE